MPDFPFPADEPQANPNPKNAGKDAFNYRLRDMVRTRLGQHLEAFFVELLDETDEVSPVDSTDFIHALAAALDTTAQRLNNPNLVSDLITHIQARA